MREATISELFDQALEEQPELFVHLDLSPLRLKVEDATELDLIQFLLLPRGGEA